MEIGSLLNLLVFFVFVYVIISILRRKLNNFPPSPFLSFPVIGHLYILTRGEPLHRALAKISDRYGPLLFLRFGSRPILLVSSPSAAEECLTKNDIVFANRPRLLAGKHLGYGYTTLTWTSYGDHWRNLRRIASVEILSNHRMQMFADTRKREVHLLVKDLFKGSTMKDDDHVMEMKPALFAMMLNIMMSMIAGKRYYGDGSRDFEETRAFKEMVTETFLLSGATNLGDFIPVLRWIGVDKLENKLKILKEKRDNFMQDLIDQHRRILGSEGKRDRTLIDVLLSLQETDPELYTDEIIKGLLQVMLTAGTDTSVGTMEWAMSLLLNNPDTLRKAQDEIEDKIGHSRLIDHLDLPQLPYLHGIISETLRMYPADPVLVPHESSAKCTVGEYQVPRGTMLLVNLWHIQNCDKFWKNARKFDPERFFGFEDQRDGFVFMPFGYGRRGCPGENLAMQVVGLALGSLIQCFEWERVGGDLVDMSEGPGLTMPKDKPLVAKCRPRQMMKKLLSQI